MKRIVAMFSQVAMSLLLATAGAHAQSALHANIPFGFEVDHEHMSAGSYTVSKEAGNDFVTIRNVQTGKSVMTLGRKVSASKLSHKLVFAQSGDRYSLASIWGDAGNDGIKVPVRKARNETMSASLRINKEGMVEIALR